MYRYIKNVERRVEEMMASSKKKEPTKGLIAPKGKSKAEPKTEKDMVNRIAGYVVSIRQARMELTNGNES